MITLNPVNAGVLERLAALLSPTRVASDPTSSPDTVMTSSP
jgi:hypothetical protein